MLNPTSRTALGPRLLFLVGVPRSGTTWLQTLLASHPEVTTAQESHLFNHALSPLLAAWSQMIHFDDGRGGIGLPAYLTEEEMTAVLRRVVHDVLSHAEGFDGCKVFVDLVCGAVNRRLLELG